MHVTNSMRQQNQLRYFKNSGLKTSLQFVDIRYDKKKIKHYITFSPTKDACQS